MNHPKPPTPFPQAPIQGQPDPFDPYGEAPAPQTPPVIGGQPVDLAPMPNMAPVYQAPPPPKASYTSYVPVAPVAPVQTPPGAGPGFAPLGGGGYAPPTAPPQGYAPPGYVPPGYAPPADPAAAALDQFAGSYAPPAQGAPRGHGQAQRGYQQPGSAQRRPPVVRHGVSNSTMVLLIVAGLILVMGIVVGTFWQSGTTVVGLGDFRMMSWPDLQVFAISGDQIRIKNNNTGKKQYVEYFIVNGTQPIIVNEFIPNNEARDYTIRMPQEGTVTFVRVQTTNGVRAGAPDPYTPPRQREVQPEFFGTWGEDAPASK